MPIINDKKILNSVNMESDAKVTTRRTNDDVDRLKKTAVLKRMTTEAAALTNNNAQSDLDYFTIMDFDEQQTRPVTPGADLLIYDNNDVFTQKNELWNPSKPPVFAVRENAAKLKEAYQNKFHSHSRKKINSVSTPYVTAVVVKYSTIYTTTTKVADKCQPGKFRKTNRISSKFHAIISSSSSEKEIISRENDASNAVVNQKALQAANDEIIRLKQRIEKLNKDAASSKMYRVDMSPSPKRTKHSGNKSHKRNKWL
jgi:hypothetical protein